MLCSVYVTYELRGKVYRDRIATNLLAADAEALAREQEGQGYDSVSIEDYPAWLTFDQIDRGYSNNARRIVA